MQRCLTASAVPEGPPLREVAARKPRSLIYTGHMTDQRAAEDPVSPRSLSRPSRSVKILAGLVAVEGLALAVTGVFQTVAAFVDEHAMPVAAIMIMSLLYIAYGVWLLGAARGLLRGSLWPRALILLSQIFLVVISVQLAGEWGWGLAPWPILYGALVALLLFSNPVQRHLLRANDLPARDAG